MPDYVELRLHPEERLRLIEDNVRDYAIFVVDPQGHIASWNLGASRIIGYREAEAIGMDCAEIFTAEDRARGAVEAEREKARQTGRAEDERWHVRKDGTRFWGSGIMTALYETDHTLRGYAKILRDETQRKMAEEARVEQERRNAVLQERNRLAQEIHDTLAQSFTAIHLQLETLKEVLAPERDPTVTYVNRIQELAREGLAETRRSVQALRPQILEHTSLPEAILQIAEEIRANSGLDVQCVVLGEPIALPPPVEDHLLRITQEAVTNVLRHAEASKLEMALAFEPGLLAFDIQDDGQGFDPQQRGESFGLVGLKERARSIGAQLALTSEAGKGTRIALTLPLRSQHG